MRIGHGYDAHRLEANRELILGGVEIPFEKGLQGHSDADVLLHAVTDAVLGAAALGDIGAMFPDSDPATEGIDSSILLAKAVERVETRGYRVVNVDCTIIAQAPRLMPYLPRMCENLTKLLKVRPDAVNIKATTEEGMGFTGVGAGIAAHAVVLLE